MQNRNKSTLVLSNNDIHEIIRYHGLDTLMDSLISRMSTAMKTFNPEKTNIPIRSGFNYEFPSPGLIELMPLYEQEEHVMIKVVGYHPSNPRSNGWPTILSTVSLYDTSSGHLTGLMDGVLLTALRTGAASVIASKLLAHPQSKTLGLIGCGTQAITQLHAISRLFNLKKVLIFDAATDAVFSFKRRCEVLELELKIVETDISTMVASADIICTATSIGVGEGPLFKNLNSQAHLHINAVGSDFPGKIELPLDFLKNSFVCPDFTDQAILEGECQQLSKNEIAPNLIEVIKNPEAYAYVQNQRSVFDSTGYALEDQVAMELFMEYAAELGLGQEIKIEHMPEDAKNPYDFMTKAVEKIQA